MSTEPEITVLTPLRHPRLRYVLRIIGHDLGYRFRFLNDRSVFGTAPPAAYTISYGPHPSAHVLPHHPFLSGKDTAPAPPHTSLPDHFTTPDGPDLLSCIFYCLSRYEEYHSTVGDRHGRFPATAGHAHRHGYLRQPVVRQWTATIGRRLCEWFADLPPPRSHAFDFRPTYDIDLLWAFRYRGWRGVASGLRDLLTGHPTRARARWLATDDRDPYFRLADLEALHRDHGLRATYFWLLADSPLPEDPNPYPVPAAQRRVMRALAATSDAGIHPSYRTLEQTELVAEEQHRLAEIIDRPVTRSRQHFLRLSLPTTYRALLRAGITDDHSMGFADRVGWRAGTNLPFPWYDLERERETRLTIHPFAGMDVTLKDYEGVSAEDAGAIIFEMAGAIGDLGGPFPLLWHNSSFAASYGWAGWEAMYFRLVGQLSVFQARSNRSSTPG